MVAITIMLARMQVRVVSDEPGVVTFVSEVMANIIRRPIVDEPSSALPGRSMGKDRIFWACISVMVGMSSIVCYESLCSLSIFATKRTELPRGSPERVARRLFMNLSPTATAQCMPLANNHGGARTFTCSSNMVLETCLRTSSSVWPHTRGILVLASRPHNE